MTVQIRYRHFPGIDEKFLMRHWVFPFTDKVKLFPIMTSELWVEHFIAIGVFKYGKVVWITSVQNDGMCIGSLLSNPLLVCLLIWSAKDYILTPLKLYSSNRCIHESGKEEMRNVRQKICPWVDPLFLQAVWRHLVLLGQLWQWLPFLFLMS